MAFLHQREIIWSFFNDINILKSSGAKPNRFFRLIVVPYDKVITNSVINKICNEKIKVQFFAEIFVPTSHLNIYLYIKYELY